MSLSGFVPGESSGGPAFVELRAESGPARAAFHGLAPDRPPVLGIGGGGSQRLTDGILVWGRLLPGPAGDAAATLRKVGRAVLTGDLGSVPQIDGECTIVAVSAERREIWVVRDFGGSRVVLWAETADGFGLDSSLPDLVVRSRQGFSVSARRLLEFLTRGAAHDDSATLIEGVRLVEPNAVTRFSAAGATSEPLVSGVRAGAELHESRSRLTRRIRELLTESIERRLLGRNAVAVALSGGLDSSSMAALAARLRSVTGHEALRLVACTIENRRVPTEVGLSAALARQLGAEHRVIRYDGHDFWRAYREIQDRSEWPMHTIGVFHHWRTAAEAAAAGCDALLDGNGADALLFGGRRAFYTHVYSSLRRGRLLEGIRSAWNYWRRYGGTVRKDVSKFARRTDHMSAGRSMWDLLQRSFSEAAGRDLRRKGFIRDLRETVIDHAIRGPAFVNGTMSGDVHGIDLMFPFCAPELITYCLRLPPSQRFAGRLPKALLREAMEDLPDSIRWSAIKAGSNDAEWRGTLRAHGPGLEESLLADDSPLASILDRDVVREEIGLWWEERPSISSIDVFRLVSADYWLRSLRARSTP